MTKNDIVKISSYYINDNREKVYNNTLYKIIKSDNFINYKGIPTIGHQLERLFNPPKLDEYPKDPYCWETILSLAPENEVAKAIARKISGKG